jgi:hypothetical protein
MLDALASPAAIGFLIAVGSYWLGLHVIVRRVPQLSLAVLMLVICTQLLGLVFRPAEVFQLGWMLGIALSCAHGLLDLHRRRKRSGG